MTVITMPTDIRFGKVIGRFVLSVSDGVDADNLPDAVPATGRIIFTPVGVRTKATSPVPTTVIKRTMSCQINDDGWIIDQQNNNGIWLLEGTYKVTYQLSEVDIKTHDIYVLPEHTEANPLDLYYSQPPSGEILSPTQYAELDARLSGIEMTGVGLHADSHGIGGSDPVSPKSIGAVSSYVSTYSNTDLNTLIDAGVYFAWTGNTNAPPSGQASGYLEVWANNPSNVYREWTSYNENAVSEIERWVRVMRGDAWTPWRAIGPIRGFGIPEGRRIAPIGTEYIDLNATAGASKWRKQSGSGSTGWIVTEGDTGLRSVSYLLDNTMWELGGAAGVRIRRVGNTVSVVIVTKNISGTTQAGSLFDMPDGFGADSPGMRAFFSSFRNLDMRMIAHTVSVSTIIHPGDTIWASVSYLTAKPWPTTLPGDPA